VRVTNTINAFENTLHSKIGWYILSSGKILDIKIELFISRFTAIIAFARCRSNYDVQWHRATPPGILHVNVYNTTNGFSTVDVVRKFAPALCPGKIRLYNIADANRMAHVVYQAVYNAFKKTYKGLKHRGPR